MSIGSCTGAVCYASWAHWLRNYYDTERPTFTNTTLENGSEDIASAVSYAQVSTSARIVAQLHEVNALFQAFRWLIAVAITYPITFCCIFASNFLVLDRMVDFTRPVENNSVSIWRQFGRIFLGFSSVGSAIGFCTNVGASAIFEQSAQEFLKARTSGNIYQSRQDALEKAALGSKFFFCFLIFEALMLLLSVGAFSIAGAISAHRINTALKSVASDLQSSMKMSLHPFAPNRLEAIQHAVHSGRRLKQQIVVTCFIVFLSFLLRSVFSTMMALALIGQNANVSCPNFSGRCDKCYNVYTHVLIYLLYKPEFFFSTIFISQPLALLVLLWGMTSGHTLAMMNGQS
jgi:hypothetical protein